MLVKAGRSRFSDGSNNIRIPHRQSGEKFMKPVVLMLVFGIAGISAALKPTQSRRFEVASVKLLQFPPSVIVSKIPAPATIRVSGNRVSLRGSVANLVLAAFNLKGFQVSNAPSWAIATWYDIDAKSEGDETPSTEQARQMLQALLADRFQLRVHYEKKELAVYDLIIGKNGSKLKETEGERPVQAGQRPGWTQVRATNRDMANIINILSAGFDRPVLDKTGLTGRYDFRLEFSRNNPDLHPFDSPEADHSVFDAVEQQLGLKLVPAKEMVEIIVIDSVQRPSEN